MYMITISRYYIIHTLVFDGTWKCQRKQQNKIMYLGFHGRTLKFKLDFMIFGINKLIHFSFIPFMTMNFKTNMPLALLKTGWFITFI